MNAIHVFIYIAFWCISEDLSDMWSLIQVLASCLNIFTLTIDDQMLSRICESPGLNESTHLTLK